ncbi:hypothetical protein ACTXT7_007462 [Hymenolepis weldensis]
MVKLRLAQKRKKARLARVNQAKSAEKRSYLHSPSQSVDSMTNATSILYNNSLVNRFMEKMTPLSLQYNADNKEKAICRAETDDSLSVCPVPLIPSPSVSSYQRAVIAAINYTKHISVNEEAQLNLIHLLLCLEQAVNRNYTPCMERPPPKVHDVKDVLQKIHPVFGNDTIYRYGKSILPNRKRSSSGLSNNSKASNKGHSRRRHRRFCPCCLEDSPSLGYSRASEDESRIRPEKDVEGNIRTDECISDTTENDDGAEEETKNRIKFT